MPAPAPGLAGLTRSYHDLRNQVTHANDRLGLQRENWLMITRMAIRILLPFVAIWLIHLIFPPSVEKVILVPGILVTIFFAALYGTEVDKPAESPQRKSDFHEMGR